MNLAAQPAPRNYHHCNMVAIQYKYQPAHQTSGLPRPPASAWWGDEPSALRGPGLHVLTDLGAHVPTLPLVLQNSAPTSTLAARGLAQKATWGNWRGITAHHAVITSPAASETVMSTYCAQGTCLSLNINMNKPLSSFILLSLQSEPCASHLQLAAHCSRCAFCEAMPATASFLPSLLRASGARDGQLRRGISSHLCVAQDTVHPVERAQQPVTAPMALQEPGQSCVPCGSAARLSEGSWTTFNTDLGNEDLARP